MKLHCIHESYFLGWSITVIVTLVIAFLNLLIFAFARKLKDSLNNENIVTAKISSRPYDPHNETQYSPLQSDADEESKLDSQQFSDKDNTKYDTLNHIHKDDNIKTNIHDSNIFPNTMISPGESPIANYNNDEHLDDDESRDKVNDLLGFNFSTPFSSKSPHTSDSATSNKLSFSGIIEAGIRAISFSADMDDAEGFKTVRSLSVV